MLTFQNIEPQPVAKVPSKQAQLITLLQQEGAVSLTLKVLHFEGCKPLVEKAFYETAIV